jgi:hypothetical protein
VINFLLFFKKEIKTLLPDPQLFVAASFSLNLKDFVLLELLLILGGLFEDSFLFNLLQLY